MITFKFEETVGGGTVEIEGVRVSFVAIKSLLNNPPSHLLSVKREGDQIVFTAYRTPEEAAKYFTKLVKWWGYLHQNGTHQLKRWFGDPEDYKGDCQGNPFVIKVVEPFDAATEEEAYEILAKKLES